MRVKIVSDLHLEFRDVDIPNNGCDVLILSGDIMIAKDLHDHPRNEEYTKSEKAFRFRNFLDRCSSNFPHVIYIAGNHEFYHGKWYATIDYLREEISHYNNIYLLEKDVKVIDDYAFLGCTLWTDLNKGDPMTMQVITNSLNDYRVIRNDQKEYSKLRSVDTYSRHLDHKGWLKDNLKNYEKCVVVTHHGPSSLSIHPDYKDEFHLNGAYSSDLSELILDNPQIKLWTHGHTHHAVQYNIGDTQVVCNPRGYEGHEPDSGWDRNLVIEL